MSIPDWLNYIKDKFNDASSYSMVAEQVAMLEERIRLRDDRIGDLVGKVADLEAQINTARTELSAKTHEASDLKEQIDKFEEQEQFDVISGVAFKRGERDGEYEQSPRCPNCHLHLGFDPMHVTTDYACTCGHKVVNASRPGSLIEKLKEDPLSFRR